MLHSQFDDFRMPVRATIAKTAWLLGFQAFLQKTVWRGVVLLALMATGLSCALAGEADVIGATAKRQSDGRYYIEAKIRSKDTGWNYYADRFEVVSLEGQVLATRILAHPHVDEQPFVRELADVRVPPNTRVVIVRAQMKGTSPASTQPNESFKLALP